MTSFAFMLKTYGDDVKFVERLVQSYHKHNHDSIHLFIVLPKADLPLFQKFASGSVSLIQEEDIPCRRLPSTVNPRQAGYTNSSVFKLAFHRLGLAHNYMCLDSDGLFIRDFTLKDFIHSDGLPYQILVQDKALQSDREYVETYWDSRQSDLDGIASYLAIENSRSLKTCHGFQIFQTKVLEKFERAVLRFPEEGQNKTANELDFVDLISLFAFESTWYNYFLQKTEPVIHEIEPLFPYIHSGKQLVELQLFSRTNDDLAKGYVGVVVNGNFQHFSWPADLHTHRVLNASAYLTTVELLRLSMRFSTALLIRFSSRPVAFLRRLILLSFGRLK